LVFLVLFFGVTYFIIPPVAYNHLGGKEVIESINPPLIPSDQPDIVRVSKDEKKIVRLSQLDLYTELVLKDLRLLPGFVVDYFDIDRFRGADTSYFFGIFADPLKNDPFMLLEYIYELNPDSVGVRLYMDETLFDGDKLKIVKSFVKNLHYRGIDIFLVLAQTSQTKNIKNQKIFFEKIFEEFDGIVTNYQVGEAINRIKWGIIMKDEYARFYKNALDAREDGGYEINFAAPSVIDFEWYYTLYYLDVVGERNVDILNSLLYVDRRGAPENEQYGFDSIEKMELMKAISPRKPFWITEVNWPIKGTGEYKPTSEDEAVSLEEYSNYMVRYMILALASEVVDRVYWWQLAAKGYGLVDHTDMSKTEAFYAYRFMIEQLKGLTFASLSEEGGVYSVRFFGDEKEVELYWCNNCDKDSGSFIDLQPNKRYYNIYGEEIELPILSSSPVYAVNK